MIEMCPIVTYGALSNSGVAGEPEMPNLTLVKVEFEVAFRK